MILAFTADTSGATVRVTSAPVAVVFRRVKLTPWITSEIVFVSRWMSTPSTLNIAFFAVVIALKLKSTPASLVKVREFAAPVSSPLTTRR